MARQVKCKGCGNSIDKDKAYCHIHTTKSGKEQNQYFCNEKEFLDILKEKDFYRKAQYCSDDILGHPITNSQRNKEFQEVHNNGYSWEQIYKFLDMMKDEIKDMIRIKDITVEYQQIRYLCQVLKNGIYDFVNENYIENESIDNQKVEEEKVETIVEESDEDIRNRLKNKNNKTNGFSDFLNNLK